MYSLLTNKINTQHKYNFPLRFYEPNDEFYDIYLETGVFKLPINKEYIKFARDQRIKIMQHIFNNSSPEQIYNLHNEGNNYFLSKPDNIMKAFRDKMIDMGKTPIMKTKLSSLLMYLNKQSSDKPKVIVLFTCRLFDEKNREYIDKSRRLSIDQMRTTKESDQ